MRWVYSSKRQLTSVEDLKLKTIEEWGKIGGEILNKISYFIEYLI